MSLADESNYFLEADKFEEKKLRLTRAQTFGRREPSGKDSK